MSMQKLPNEILEEIFRIVQLESPLERNLTSCSVVCQAWHLPACRILFEELTVKGINQLLGHLASQNNNLGVYCKVLKFSSFYEEDSPSEKYEQLFSYLPNLRTIIFESFYRRAYHLTQIAQQARLIKHLQEILLEGDWRIGEPQSYYRCAIAFKTTLQRMKLESVGEIISSIDGRIGDMISFFPEFTALTTLQITNQNSLNFTMNLSQIAIFSILRSCPNLISFSMNINFQELKDEDMNCTFNHGKLKYLNISLPEFTKNHFSYMIANITQLKELRLERKSTKPILWMKNFGPDILNRFQRYLADIQNVDLDIKGNFKANIAEYWLFLSNSIARNQSTPTHVRLEIYDRSTSHCGGTSLIKRIDSIRIYCRLNVNVYSSISELLFSPLLLQTTIAPSELSENNIETFHLMFESRYGQSTLYGLPSRMLESITSGFRNLTDFRIKINFLSTGIGSPIGSSIQISVSSKEIDDDEYGYFAFTSSTASQHRLNLPSNKLAYAKLRSIKSTKDITSMLNYIPNVKYLKLLDCNLTRENNFNITLDLNNLQLQQLTIEITSLIQRGSNLNTVVLHIEGIDVSRTTCYQWNRENRNFQDTFFESDYALYTKNHGQFSSRGCNIMFVKCNKLGKIMLYNKVA